MKYNVIWLDDHFGITKDPMEVMYSNFLRSQEKGRFQNFEITRCKTSDQVKEYLKNDARYQAVILDVFGKVNENHSSDSMQPFFELWEFLENKDLIVKIFSGELNKNNNGKAIKDYIAAKNLKDKEDYFDKIDDYPVLFERLQSDLDKKLSLYKIYPELLGLIQEGFLSATAKKDLDQLLIDNKKLDLCFDNKGYFRELRTHILKGLSDIGVIPESPKRDPLSYLVFPGKFNKEKNKYENVNVSDEICPNVVKRAFYFVGNVANNFHHLDETPLKEDYYPTLLPAMYNAMILVLRWYYQIRKKYENQ